MSRITAAAEVDAGSLEGADQEPWPKFIEQYNELGRQVVANINQNGPLLDCPTSKLVEYDLLHGASVTIKNPLAVPIKSIMAVSCIGLSVDSTGKPTRGVYNLARPSLEWHNSTKGDGSVVVTPYYSPDGLATGALGEMAGPITRVASNGTPLATTVVSNVCTSPSITLTAGKWRIGAQADFDPAATSSVTRLDLGISTTSATLPAADTQTVPTSGECRVNWASAANVMVLPQALVIPPYRVEVAAGSTLILFLVARATYTVTVNDLLVCGSMEAVREVPYATGILGRVGLFFAGEN